MARSPNVDFEVRWLPYQLNPQASEQPSSKMQMYMKKFNRTEAQVREMSGGMKEKFSAVGLPFKTEGDALVANTFQAHRIQTAAYNHGGAAAQDKAVEVIFNAYFGEGKAPNDPLVLEAAAKAAGLDAKTVVAEQSIAAKEVQKELGEGRRIVESGVPHFVFKNSTGKTVQLSGAQPPEQFLHAFASLDKSGSEKGCLVQ